MSSDSSGRTSSFRPDELDNIADDVTLGNPLQRMKRLSTGWMGVIIDYEGIVVDNMLECEIDAWTRLVDESKQLSVLQWQLQRAVFMKNEQAVSEVLCLTRNPSKVRELASRKEQFLEKCRRGTRPTPAFGLKRFLRTLQVNEVPVAIVSCGPEKRVKEEQKQLGLIDEVEHYIYAEDTARSRPDAEPYWYASTLLKRPLERCVVITASNLSIEAAKDAGMKTVAIATSSPLYELSSADLAVKGLDNLTFVNLKQLFGQEGGRLPTSSIDELELEEQLEEFPIPSTITSVL